MKSVLASSRQAPAITVEAGQRLMLRCAGGYILASALAAALGFTGIGEFSLAAVVLLLLTAALLLAAGLLCSALGVLCAEEQARRFRQRG